MKKGFTLAELLLVVALLMIIMLIFLINIRGQLNKANDARRKTDLEKIQKSLEEYYNDNHTYPAYSPFGNCGSNSGSDLTPYLPSVPCDPTSRIPYKYIPGQPFPMDGYIVCARLQDLSDPVIKKLGCDPVLGWGWGLGYNYCVSSGSVVTAAGAFSGGSGSNNGNGGSNGGGSNGGGSNNGGNGGGSNGGGNGTPTPTPTPAVGIWACTPDGSCNAYADPTCDGGGACCPHTYQAFGCTVNGADQCSKSVNRCTRY